MLRDRTLQVALPKGIRAGQQIRLSGQGSPGLGAGPPGDLYLEIHFRPHPLYRVDGRDVYLDLPVAPWEAALGTETEVPTLDGPVMLTIPKGSSSGKLLRIKGRGFSGKDGTRGDLLVLLEQERRRPLRIWATLSESL